MDHQQQLYEDLLAVRRNLKRRTWTKGRMHMGDRSCLLGHIQNISDHSSRREVNMKIAIKRVMPLSSEEISLYNDASRSVRRVQRLVDRAIEANKPVPAEAIDPHNYNLT